MKLIKIEIEGFKSFADPVSISFDGSVVGIVGPNGSGKSNINDAIRWVLGEKSAKQLRGSNMDDVIFAGSKTVKALDKAMVRLTFQDLTRVEESSQIFTIARVLKRGEGTNEYLFNGQPVRYKDIRNLAVESGISKSSLAIISQGTISEIAEATPEQRKAVIEEVAGTAKYKLDKQEALTKLDQTQNALEKIEIKIKELERQTKNLEKQAENAKIYLEKSKALESVEVALIVADLNDFLNKFDVLKSEIQELASNEKFSNDELDKQQQIIVKNIEIKNELEKQLSEIQQKINSYKDQINQINIEQAKAESMREMILSGQIQVDYKQKLEALRSEYVQTQTTIQNTEKQIDNLQNQRYSIEKQQNELSSSKQEVDSNLRKIINLKSQAEAQINQIKEKLERQSFLPKGTKTIVDNKHLFSGYCGIVSELIQIKPEYVSAIESAIGPALKQIVTNSSEDAVQAVNFLKKNASGTATFIPLSSIKGRTVNESHMLAIRGQKGFIDVAINLVSFENKYEILAEFLLGSILVVDTIETANKIAKIIDFKYVVVTLDGDLVRPSGTITGGQKVKTDSVFNLQQELDQLESKYDFCTKKESDLYNILYQKETEIKNLNSQINNLNIEIARLKDNLSNLNNKLFKIQADNAQYSKDQEDFNNSDSIIENNFLTKLELENKLNALELTRKSQADRLSSLAEEINEMEIENKKLSDKQRQFNNSLNDKKTQLNKLDMLINDLQNKLSQKYGLTFENASQNYSLEIEIGDARRFVDTLNAEIKALGNVNLNAIEDFATTKERFDKLLANQEELETAKSKILEAISDLDKIIINKTMEVLEMVNSEFNLVFQNMFGGGSAKIYFTDKNDILNSGVEISAQPPGKTIKNLKLFSGGEKAIIAISLLFSIIKARPIPLCILDEVEAALDESNVIRYVEFLKQLKANTQFLIITHRHGTMSRVDQLLGVTMQKRGVTSIFSIELSKAKELLKNEMQ